MHDHHNGSTGTLCHLCQWGQGTANLGINVAVGPSYVGVQRVDYDQMRLSGKDYLFYHGDIFH